MSIQAITASAESEQLRASAVNTQNSWDDLLDEMNGIDDPFQKMAYALYTLMPAILEDKEEELDNRATDLEGLGGLVSAAAAVHETFNSFAQFEVPTDEAVPIVQQLRSELNDLQVMIKAAERSSGPRTTGSDGSSGFIDPVIAEQAGDAVQGMLDWLDEQDYGDAHAAHRLVEVWNGEAAKNNQYIAQYDDGKFWIDELNVVETSFKSISGVAQTELQYDIGFYEVMVGSYKDMFQQYKGQVQSAVDGTKKL